MSEGAVFDWYTSNTEIDYPFDSRTADGSYRLFVDAYIQHNKHRTESSRLQLVTFDPSGVCDLRFEDGTALVNLSSADGFNSFSFGDYIVYRWKKSTTISPGFTDDDLVVQLVCVSAELSNFSFPLSPPQAFFLSSLVNPRTSRARRAALAIEGLPCCSQFTTDQIILQEGNNVSISLRPNAQTAGLGIVSPSTLRAPTTIVFDAIGGAGAGRVIDCDSLAPPIKKINEAGPNANGNLTLSGVDCTWVERRTSHIFPPIHPNTDYSATMIPALLQLHEDCKACCDCEDYENAYATLSKLWDRARVAAAKIEEVRKLYNQLVNRINQIKLVTETGLNIKTQAIARPDYHLAVQITVWNDSKFDITAPILIVTALDTLNFQYAPHSGIVDTAGLHKAQIDPLPIGGNGLEFIIPGLKSTGFATCSFEVRYPQNTLNHSGLPVSRVGRIVRVFGNATYDLVLVTEIVNVPLTGPLVKN